MIRFEGVTRLFGAVKAVDSLDLAIHEKELCVLVGPSGSGKSTMLRMINRLIEPTGGSVSLDGKDIRAMRPEILRRGIGYVIQSVGLFPHLTVAANVATVPQLLGWDRPRIEERVDRMLTLVGMDPAVYRGRYPHELSGGEAQRIGVARALASDPPVILMDEPFSAVDPVNRQRLQDEFLSIQRELKKTVVFVTHDVDEAIRLADRIAVVRAGRLVQYDMPEKILEHPADPFVAAFVGADRALKRLSRFAVRGYMRPAVSTRIDDVPPPAAGRGAFPLGRRYRGQTDREPRHGPRGALRRSERLRLNGEYPRDGRPARCVAEGGPVADAGDERPYTSGGGWGVSASRGDQPE